MTRPQPIRVARRGATLLELAVVIAVIGILAALLLPAVQATRARSWQVRCASNLRQLGIATGGFVSTHGEYPQLHSYPLNHRGPMSNESFQARLLPYLDQRALYDQLDHDVMMRAHPPSPDGPNGFALQITVPVFVCPADDVPAGGNSYRSCYGTTPGIHATWRRGGSPSRPLDQQALWGVLIGAHRPEDVEDGTSNTVLFSERIVGDGDPDSYSPWSDVVRVEGDHYLPGDAYAGCSAVTSGDDHSSMVGLWWLPESHAHTGYNHILPPNSRIPDCVDGWNSIDLGQGAISARSYHPGGVNALYADGSSRFTSETIDLRVWRAVATYDGSEAISDF